MLLSNKQIELMNANEKIKYYNELKNNLKNSKYNNRTIVRKTFNSLVQNFRNYDFEVKGIENIPTDSSVLFVANHSNAHDFFTMQEAMKIVGINQSFLASNEDLNSLILTIFEKCGGVLFNRSDKNESEKAFIEFAGRLSSGESGIIYGESTWNMHPYKPMHLIKTGAVYLACIANIPIVPLIYEYIEVNECCKKEKDLFSKCVVTFGKPFYVSQEDSLFAQTDIVQKQLENLRRSIWNNYHIKKENFTEEDINVYLNHTYLKKFGGAGDYDSNRENKYLLVKDQISSENEYHLDENSNFVPGILSREEGKKYILKNHI